MLLGNCNKPLEALLEKILHSDEFACVKWHVQVSSTQDLAKNFIRESTCKTSAVFVADSQTSGRGTRGRIWHAPAVNLMMTVVAPLAVSLNQTSGLTLAAGAAAVEVLREVRGIYAYALGKCTLAEAEVVYQQFYACNSLLVVWASRIHSDNGLNYQICLQI